MAFPTWLNPGKGGFGLESNGQWGPIAPAGGSSGGGAASSQPPASTGSQGGSAVTPTSTGSSSGAGSNPFVGPPSSGGGIMNPFTGFNTAPAFTTQNNGTYFDNSNPQNFMSAAQSGPFTGAIGLGTTMADFGAQSIPNAAEFQNQLFSPGMTPIEDSFMQSNAALQSQALNRSMAQLEAQYGSTPMNSGLFQAFNTLGQNMGLQLGNQALQLATNRENLAANDLGNVLGNPLSDMTTASGQDQALTGMLQNLLTSPYGMGLSYLNATPYISPSIIQQGASGGSGK